MTRTRRWLVWASRRVLPVVLFAAFWTCVAWAGRLPHLPAVLAAVDEMIQAGTYFHDIVISCLRFAIGWVAGCLLAIPLGLMTGRGGRAGPLPLRIAARAVEANFHGLRAIPVIALVPLAVYLGGIGEVPKVCLIAWGVFFPVWVAAHTGAAGLNPGYLHAAASLGITGRRLWAEVILPHASQAIVGGVRVGIGVGLICVVAAELTGAYERGFFSQGLGFRLQRAADIHRLDRMIACVFTFAMLGLLLDAAFRATYRPVVLAAFGFDPDRSIHREADRAAGQ